MLKKFLSTERLRRWTRDLAILIALVWGIGLYQTRNLLPAGTKVPDTLRLQDFTGAEHSFVQLLGGKAALLYFWAPWCGVCKASIANAVQATRLNNNHNQIFLIALDYGDRSEVEQFVEDAGLRNEDVFLGDDAVRDAFMISAYPTYYLADSDLNLKTAAIGYSTTIGIWTRLKLLL
jgi:thiol-disulfide isomerase/thioredoxin